MNIGKNTSYTKSETFHKMYVQGDECSSMHINNFFPIGNENFFSSQHRTYFILSSEFRIFIHNNRNCPILDNYENKIIRISLNFFYLLLKGAGSSRKRLIYSKHNKKQIQD